MARRTLPVGAALTVVLSFAGPAFGGKVTLKNGTELAGEVVEIEALDLRNGGRQSGELKTTPYLLVDAEYKRYFVSDRQVAGIDQGRTLLPFDFFELRQARSSKAHGLASVALPKAVEEFGGHGRRTVTFRTAGDDRSIVQGVTRIGPAFVTVEGINYAWWQGIATAAVEPEQLAAMIRAAIDPADSEDRMSVVRFYIQAGLYEPAAAELESLGKDFPFLAAKVEELNGDLLQLRARTLLAEIRSRQAAGQHRLALAVAESFPTELGFEAEVLRQVDELRAGYAADREKGDEALLLLGELEGELSDEGRRSVVASLRPQLRAELGWDSVGRLEAFLTLAGDDSLAPEERLALAYSGWVVGPANATTDLSKAVGLWRARGLVGEYLRTADEGRRGEVVEEIGGIEGVGPQAVADLVPLLPPWVETPGAAPGRVTVLETVESVPGWGGDGENAVTVQTAGPARYAVVLPPEYVTTRSYPLLVALRPAEWSIEQAAEFWGIGRDGAGRPAAGPATRAGYVVVAPEFASPKQAEYGYTAREHEAILAAVRDAKKRFMIDGDRVFLAGHGMGGDATFDVAMAHPDQFAGAAPVSGLTGSFTKWYWKNAERVPFYVVNGELDRNSRSRNATEISRMMKAGFDVTYCEYVGRGYEYYQEGTAEVVAWMDRLRRAADPKRVEAQVMRASDDRFYWVKAEGIPRVALAADPAQRMSPKPMSLEARIGEGNTIRLKSGASRYVVRLNGELIDLDKRVQVEVKGKRVFNDFVVPEVSTLLEDLAENADRQRIYPVRLVVE